MCSELHERMLRQTVRQKHFSTRLVDSLSLLQGGGSFYPRLIWSKTGKRVCDERRVWLSSVFIDHAFDTGSRVPIEDTNAREGPWPQKL